MNIEKNVLCIINIKLIIATLQEKIKDENFTINVEQFKNLISEEIDMQNFLDIL